MQNNYCFRALKDPDSSAISGSDSPIVGHFSVLHTDRGIRSKSGRVITPVIKLGYPDPGGLVFAKIMKINHILKA